MNLSCNRRSASGVQTASLEELLGDPYDPQNPCGHEAVLAADERRELPAAAVRALDAWGFNAELVPASLGGRLTGTDQLVRALRPVFRRDGALGLGYGITNFMAAMNVWMSGNDEQRRHLATTLLDGGKIAAAYHELGHGNDLLHNELRADDAGDHFAITGRKEVINNAAYAGHAVVFARTDAKPGPRSHSLLLVDTTPDALRAPTSTVDASSLTRLPRFRTVGMRGCHLSGFEFDRHRVPANSLIGAPGTAVETALRSFQVTRCVTAGLGVGSVDAVLAAVFAFAQQRRLYGGTLAQIPHARTVIADAFADLLVADAFVTTTARLLHTAPRHGSRYAASVKYLVPILLEDAARSLAVVLGARSFLRSGEYAIVGKHLRDLPVLSIGHAGGTACLLTVLPQLISLGRLGEGTDTVPASTFDTTALPELDVSALCLLGRGHDPLIGTLAAQLDDLSRAVDPPARAVVDQLRGELRALLDDARSLPANGCGVDAAPAAFRLAERYALLAAAACCIGVWQAGRLPTTVPGSTWLRALLGRLAARLGHPTPGEPDRDEALFGELTRRATTGLDFCIDADPVHRPHHQ